MQSGTVGAFINQFARQVFVDSDITLSAQQLNGTIIVDNSTGPVTVTLPPAVSIRAGGYFQVFALTGNNPVTVVVQPGDVYNAGEVAPIVLSSAGQILTVFATNAQNIWGIPLTVGSGAGIELMVGPSDFRGPDFGHVQGPGAAPPPGVESFVTNRTISGIDFNAFRLSPENDAQAVWSYTLPRRNKPNGTYSVTVTIEWADDPAPSFFGRLAFGLADQGTDIAVGVGLSSAGNVQTTAIGNGAGNILSVLEWEFPDPQFPDPTSRPFLVCVLAKPGGAGPIMYMYEATLSYRGP